MAFLICAWYLLVPSPAREEILNADHQRRSSAGVELECAFELGHRGVLSRELGRYLLRERRDDLEEGVPEEYAFYRQVGLAEARAHKLRHPVQLTRLQSMLRAGRIQALSLGFWLREQKKRWHWHRCICGSHSPFISCPVHLPSVAFFAIALPTNDVFGA